MLPNYYICEVVTVFVRLEANMTKIDPVINLEKAEDSSDGNSKNASFSPPDGGLLAWFIVIASFLTNGIIFGIHNCYGILYVHLKSQLEQHGIEGAATKACKEMIK